MRRSWVLRKLHILDSGIRNVGGIDILDQVDSLDGSTMVETEFELRGRKFAYADIFSDHQRMSFCCVWSKKNLADDILNYMCLR